MDLSNCHLNRSDYDNDTLIGTVHYARTGDYDPGVPRSRKGYLNLRAIHAIIIVGKSTESGEIFLVAPFSSHWPDRTHKVPASEYVIGGTGEIHAGVPYRIHKDKIRTPHDGGRKMLKPGALERLLARIQENKFSSPPLQRPAQERRDGGSSQPGRRFGCPTNYRGRNTAHCRITLYPQNY
ncbi:hypothetical protein F5887DRAFT_119565 [Amanita rubescens]|nr:hypothetical protein F5887DRAFT_119565 [Amanita rubescens]